MILCAGSETQISCSQRVHARLQMPVHEGKVRGRRSFLDSSTLDTASCTVVARTTGSSVKTNILIWLSSSATQDTGQPGSLSTPKIQKIEKENRWSSNSIVIIPTDVVPGNHRCFLMMLLVFITATHFTHPP